MTPSKAPRPTTSRPATRLARCLSQTGATSSCSSNCTPATTAVPPADPVTTITGDTYGWIRRLEELRDQLHAAGIALPPAVDAALELERRGTYTHTDRYPATHPAAAVPDNARTAPDLAHQAFPGTPAPGPVPAPPPAASPQHPPGTTPGRHTR